MDIGKGILEAIREVTAFLEERGFDYALFGGVASVCWGRVRLTTDVDLTVFVEPGKEWAAREVLTGAFSSRPEFSEHFWRKSMLLLKASNGYPLDISIASTLSYEGIARERRRLVKIAQGLSVWLLSPEDLVIYKVVAGRPIDKLDVEGVILRQGKKLDVEYCREVLEQFEDIVSEHSVTEFFEDAMRAAAQSRAFAKREFGPRRPSTKKRAKKRRK